MANAIFPQAFVEQYNANVQHLAARQNHIFGGKGIRIEFNDAAAQYFDQIEGRKMRKLTSRLADTTYAQSAFWRRKVTCAPHGDATIFDNADKARGIIDPESADAKNMAFAYNAAKDDVIVAAALGNAIKKGEAEDAPDIIVPFADSQKIAVDYKTPGTNSGLTLAKLVRLKSLISRDDVSGSAKKFFVYSQDELDQLLINVQEVKNTDYAAVKALQEGTISHYLGMEWIKCESLPVADGIRTCFAYVDQALLFSEQRGRGLRTTINNVPSKWEAVEVKSLADMGGTRMREDWVSLCYCDTDA